MFSVCTRPFECWVLSHRCYPELTFRHQSTNTTLHLKSVADLTQVITRAVPDKVCVFQQVILHTGDMRWNPRMGKHPALANQRIDQLFLDTTYASPKHTFPSQVWHFTSSRHLCRGCMVLVPEEHSCCFRHRCTCL